MYKISQVAKVLDVSTVTIHEKLINNRSEFAEYIHKKNSITYIDTDGVKLLSRLIDNEHHTRIDTESKEVKNPEESDDVSLLTVEEEEMITFKLKERLSLLKTDLKKLEIEINKKDNAIEHYLGILDEDMDWLVQLEEKYNDYIDDILKCYIDDQQILDSGLVDIYKYAHSKTK